MFDKGEYRHDALLIFVVHVGDFNRASVKSVIT